MEQSIGTHPYPMQLNTLKAISPVDGRYRSQAAPLSEYFSEHALIAYRLWVEVEYFIALCEIPLPELRGVQPGDFGKLRNICEAFSEADALHIKEIEKTTNHDVKAVEYFLKEKFVALGLEEYREFIHFGLTSQDINNTAIPASLRDAIEDVLIPQVDAILGMLVDMSRAWKDVPLLARTHGQPASPTILGKEIYVFVERLDEQLERLEEIPMCGKFGGATGNFNAHHVAYPEIDWVSFANKFVFEKLELTRSIFTTQIEHYDNMAAVFDALKRLNTVLIDLCRDMWTYVSLDYFRQKVKEHEVGSSAMPHKVNPIDFENAEGNLGLANAMFEHLAAKLPVSRLQRDLTDSTVLRNTGVPVAHMLIALNSVEKGLTKLELNREKITADLEANWAVVAEALQTLLRRHGFAGAYEALKAFSRGKGPLNRTDIHAFIDSLDVNASLKTRMKEITPFNYTGIDILSAELEGM